MVRVISKTVVVQWVKPAVDGFMNHNGDDFIDYLI